MAWTTTTKQAQTRHTVATVSMKAVISTRGLQTPCLSASSDGVVWTQTSPVIAVGGWE